MNRYRKSSSYLIATALVLACLVPAGCSDDDPVTPEPLPESGYLAVTPDSLMSLWRTALTAMDSTMYSDVHHPGFRFQFRQRDIDVFQLLTDHMTRREVVETAWSMFSGEDVANWQGNDVLGVTRISFPFMTQETPWEFVAAGDAESASARFMLQLFVERGSGYPILGATGLFDFIAQSGDTVDAGGAAVRYFRLISMTEVDPPVKAAEVNTWGGVHLTYLANEAPEAALLVSDIGGTPLPLYRGDASGSRDLDSGLHPEPFRWRFDTGEPWTEWSSEPVVTRGFDDIGPKTITVEVRDRWGGRASASQEVNVPGPELPFPSTPDLLMSNFLTIYQTRYFEGYRELLHPEFLMLLQEETTTEFPDVGTTLDVGEELRIHQRMFSGEAVTDPNGDFVPGVSDIWFNRIQALDAWSLTPADDIIPNAEWAPFEVDVMWDRGRQFSYLRVQGVINFYVTSHDSLHEGTMKKYYRMLGQVDLTGLNKGVETFSWGSVKALFR